MQLDKFTDFGLRVLVTLAAHAPSRIPTSTIAQMFSLSEHHLAKVASALVKEGFAVSERGRGGGLTLAIAPETITIGAVVRALQKDKPIVSCFGTDNSCLILPTCGLRSPLAEAQEAFYSTLDRYTLADVTRQKSDLLSLLAL